MRFAIPKDAERLINDGILIGPSPRGQTWYERAKVWLVEQQAGRRLILIAEDDKNILGMVHLVFRLPEGYNDPEAANGSDIAMMEMLRTRKGANPQITERLVEEVQNIARKRNVTTLTFCVSMDHQRALAQVKAWGFQEFRIMPEKTGMLAFFKKALVEAPPS